MQMKRERQRNAVSYHLLCDGLTLRAGGGTALFAHAVARTVSGLVTHAHYAGAAQRADGVLSAAAFRRQLGVAISVDANPVAALFPPSLCAADFEARWNALDQASAFGVRTALERFGAGDGAVRRVAGAGGREAACRAERMHQLLDLLSSRRPAAGVDDARAILALCADLGAGGGATRDVLERLHDDPGASVDACAAAAGVSLRTLQRQLGRDGVRFAALKQAVRISLAGYRMRNRDESLTDTAMHAGFYDAAHMIHAWQQACGIRPAVYRSIARLPASGSRPAGDARAAAGDAGGACGPR
ncbi:hypothetical protein GQ57_03810 [Burkholderia sp. MSh2]|uniref:AraC family transcriptional regulator n=1 Tax=Burkholderia paludis TaxID=1506587 RepID=A0A6P2REW2_9BURK|nr:MULTISPECIES: helix-turn-helix domain-containing protein [Burkholderia]KEZ06908.1 hypothetical protein GQ57_03810 [Burkholderia sp. MSh2]KFG97649.1 hypothetical protein GQ56_0108955 [Burkholderia paludis]CAB3768583.1 hypothetical protein LMG30113_05757 [Burkholderia paludis]VWC33923.1 AraC family transcriptional regulator [Burkholderia paludis]